MILTSCKLDHAVPKLNPTSSGFPYQIIGNPAASQGSQRPAGFFYLCQRLHPLLRVLYLSLLLPLSLPCSSSSKTSSTGSNSSWLDFFLQITKQDSHLSSLVSMPIVTSLLKGHICLDPQKCSLRLVRHQADLQIPEKDPSPPVFLPQLIATSVTLKSPMTEGSRFPQFHPSGSHWFSHLQDSVGLNPPWNGVKGQGDFISRGTSLRQKRGEGKQDGQHTWCSSTMVYVLKGGGDHVKVPTTQSRQPWVLGCKCSCELQNTVVGALSQLSPFWWPCVLFKVS